MNSLGKEVQLPVCTGEGMDPPFPEMATFVLCIFSMKADTGAHKHTAAGAYDAQREEISMAGHSTANLSLAALSLAPPPPEEKAICSIGLRQYSQFVGILYDTHKAAVGTIVSAKPKDAGFADARS
jgi:hypothetical protein